MEINFFELLEFVQQRTGNKIFEDFLDQVNKISLDPDNDLEIRIPNDILQEFLQSKEA